MVGHTGVLESTIQAVEAVDLAIGRLVPAVRAMKGALIITADHGNADDMLEWDKKAKDFLRDAQGNPRPKTSHSLNAVPCYIDAPGAPLALADASARGIANVAATTLQLLGYEAPAAYEPSLLAAPAGA